MLLFLHLIFILTSSNTETNKELNFYITLLNNQNSNYIEAEFQIIIFDIFINNYESVDDLLELILRNISKKNDYIYTIISNAISVSFSRYRDTLADREKKNFTLFMDTLILMLNKNVSVFKDNILNYVKFLESEILGKNDEAGVYENAKMFLEEIIKNISMLIDKTLQLIVIDVYNNERHFNQIFIHFETKIDSITLKNLLYDKNFISIQLKCLSEEEIEKMGIAILKHIKDTELNIHIYFDLRLENFFVDYFDGIFNDIDIAIKKRSSKRITQFTQESFDKLKTEMDEEIKKIFSKYSKDWDAKIFGSNQVIKQEEYLVDKICYYQLDKNTYLLYKLILNYGLKQGFDNEETAFNILQQLNKYDLDVQSKLVNLLKQRINEKFMKEENEIDVTKLYNNTGFHTPN